MKKDLFEKLKRGMMKDSAYKQNWISLFDIISPQMTLVKAKETVVSNFRDESVFDSWIREEMFKFSELYSEELVKRLNYNVIKSAVAKAARKTSSSAEEIMAKIAEDLLWYYNYGTVYEQAIRSISEFVRHKLGRDHKVFDTLEHRQTCLSNGFMLKVQHQKEKAFWRISKEGEQYVHIPERKALVLVKVF